MMTGETVKIAEISSRAAFGRRGHASCTSRTNPADLRAAPALVGCTFQNRARLCTTVADDFKVSKALGSRRISLTLNLGCTTGYLGHVGIEMIASMEVVAESKLMTMYELSTRHTSVASNSALLCDAFSLLRGACGAAKRER
jgi:hypothetical protein